ncbi:MAG: hypothetical protein ITG02_02385 [Patulibacter sp.]|nr:hypothetical protein [Patulibacter sp.]
MSELTAEERRWVASLRRLAAKRPKTLGLWAGLGGVHVIALNEDGGIQHRPADGPYAEVVVLADYVDIPAGGGDPDSVHLCDIERPWVPVTPDPTYEPAATPEGGEDRA